MKQEKYLKEVELQDIGELSVMLKKFWKSQLYDVSNDEILEDIRRILSPKCFGYLIMYKEDIAGFIFANEKYGYINNIEYLFIKENFRGKGLAVFALTEIKNKILAASNPRVQIEVSPNNIRALKLYHRLGFTSIDTISLSTSISGKIEKIKFQGLDFYTNPKELFEN